MTLIFEETNRLVCNECLQAFPVPARDQAPYSRMSFRDRMVVQHKCGVKPQPVETATDNRSRSWEEMLAVNTGKETSALPSWEQLIAAYKQQTKQD